MGMKVNTSTRKLYSPAISAGIVGRFRQMIAKGVNTILFVRMEILRVFCQSHARAANPHIQYGQLDKRQRSVKIIIH